MEEQSLTTADLIGFVYRFAMYALEDSLLDFQEDVIGNQGWTEAQARQGHAALQRLIASL